jgi:redox-sensitive bicupin YhaK (pirin superfamily)
MITRTATTAIIAEPQPGTGILHPFPTPELAHLDPFVFLDTGAPTNLGDGEIYVGPHPHRGVQPVSLLFRGRIEHRDSLGNHREISSGGMQWLVAGSGALHEEVLHGDERGVFHMAQLWINVPAELKMKPAEHHAEPSSTVPELDDLGAGSVVRLYAGSLAGRRGPAPLPTPVLVAHALLEAGGDVTIAVPTGWTAAVCVVAGEVAVGPDEPLPPGATVVFGDDGDSIHIGSPSGGEVLLMAGEPIGEPIAMGGGFVMNTRDEIEASFDDYRSGRMGALAPSR